MSNSLNIGLAQINLKAGDLKYNSSKIAENIKQAEKLNLDLIVFPENTLLGFSLDDTISRHPFLINENKKWLNIIAKFTDKTTAIIGFVDCINNNSVKSAAIVKNGMIKKVLNSSDIIEINGIKYYISIDKNTDFCNKSKGAEIFIKLNSVPTRYGSEYIKNEKLSSIAAKIKIPVIHINQVGAIDNICYDGSSRMYNKDGKLTARAKSFEEQLLIVNPFDNAGEIYPIPKGSEMPVLKDKPFNIDYENDMERTYKSILQGIKDYFLKCGLKRAVLGLSGGLDSTVCAVLLADALGKENVIGISMPSKITSTESKNDAKELANNLGISFFELPIKPIVEIATESMNNLFKKIQTKWSDRYSKSFTNDNIQARSRATYLWCISNEFPSCIPIATSDKSEAYMGYATINGDMTGGFAPIADVTKTKLFALAKWLNKNRKEKNAIPESVILKRPGAELAIDPKTGKALCAEDALMPYEFLDEIIWRIENRSECYQDMLESEFYYEKKEPVSKEQKTEWLDKFYKRMSSALYKWSIMAPSVIVDSHSINKSEYSQPITSGKINYKAAEEKDILSALEKI